MPQFAQLVIGPAGSGKSTYCANMQKYCHTLGRNVHVVNLDPAAEFIAYEPLVDIRDFIQLEDVMEDDSLRFGPNGGLVFCMEYIIQHLDWLDNALGDAEDDYFLFDCPGQIELYSHLPVMKQFIKHLDEKNFRVCSVFMLDSHFMVEPTNFVSGMLTALSSMTALEVSHVNVMSKMDLLNKTQKKDLDRWLEPNMSDILSDQLDSGSSGMNHPRYRKLNKAIGDLIEDYSLVKFLPFDQSDPQSMEAVLIDIDTALQWGEDQEPSEKYMARMEALNENDDE